MENMQITNEGLETLAKFKTAQEIKGSLRTALEDVIKFSNAESKPIMGVVNATDKNLKPITNLNELLFAVKKGLNPESLGQFYKGVLKASKTDQKLLEMAAKEVVANPVFKDYKLMTEKQLRKALKAKGYSDLGIDAIVAESKVSQAVKDAKSINRLEKKMKKLQNGETKPLTPTSPTPPIPPKNFTSTLKEALLKGIASGWTWKKILIWGAGVGLTAAAIWWFLYNSNTPLPNDIPDVEPKPTADWGPCLNDLISTSQGKIATTPKGDVVVYVKSTEKYPGGLQFYSNKRVLNVQTKDMGTWSCEGSKAVIGATNESVNGIVGRILREKLISEQSSVVSDEEMNSYVDTVVDDLDGYVAEYNLKSILSVLKRLKGRTYKGENAINKFLDYYRQDEGADFITDMESVGVANLSVMAKNMKPEIIKLVSGQSNDVVPRKSTVTINEQQLNIVWDKDRTNKNSTDTTPVKSNTKKKKKTYRNCEEQDFPLAYGCVSSKIAEVQKCLGVSADGKFGPNTMKALIDDKYDTSRGLSKDVYDAIKGNCNPQKKRDLDTTIEKLPTRSLKMMDVVVPNVKAPDFTNIIQSKQQPKDLYVALKDAGYIKGDGNETTLEDGTVLPATNRVKYKGPDLDDETISKLDSIISGMGYSRIKQKLDKSYGDKYVWTKD